MTLFGLLKTIVLIGEPPQRLCVTGAALTVGCGFTVTVNVEVPTQPEAVPVRVNVVVCEILVVLTSVPVMLLPLPDAGIPVRLAVLSRVQVKFVPETPFNVPKLIVANAVPEHTDCEAGIAVGSGIGLTVMETVDGLEIQLSSEIAYSVKVTVCGLLVVFTSDPETILPLPEDASPETFAVLSRVQVNDVAPVTALGFEMVIGEKVSPEQMLCVDGNPITSGFG